MRAWASLILRRLTPPDPSRQLALLIRSGARIRVRTPRAWISLGALGAWLRARRMLLAALRRARQRRAATLAGSPAASLHIRAPSRAGAL